MIAVVTHLGAASYQIVVRTLEAETSEQTHLLRLGVTKIISLGGTAPGEQ